MAVAQTAAANKMISAAGIVFNEINYSDTGLDIGNAGFWFANFSVDSQPIPNTGSFVDFNHVMDLPNWVVPVFDSTLPGYSFGVQVTSSGGIDSWNVLVLPNGDTGLSGSLVDPETDYNSNNTVSRIVLGPETPSSFIMHIVVDNTNNQHDPAGRIRGRAQNGDGSVDEAFRYNTAPGDFDGMADVYSFRYDGWAVGDFIKIQLNSGVNGVDAGFAGLMFDVIPEPSSLMLMLLGVMTLTGLRRTRH